MIHENTRTAQKYKIKKNLIFLCVLYFIYIFSLHGIQFSVRNIRFWADGNPTGPKHDLLDLTAYEEYFKNFTDEMDVLIVIEDFAKFYILLNLFIIFRDLMGNSLAGVAWVGGMCTYKSISIVDIGQFFRFNPHALAQTIAHEVGHNLGLSHFTKSNLCRASIGECDITEYCDGKSSAVNII
ncbi:hypothetical protein HZS_4022 [Henneguya salminicola]|nr:hypothetical protein HZS_4022 [Henneguya salminicola]